MYINDPNLLKITNYSLFVIFSNIEEEIINFIKNFNIYKIVF